MFCFYSEKFDVYLKFSFAQVAEITHKLPLVLEVTITSLPEAYKHIFGERNGTTSIELKFMDNNDAAECLNRFQANMKGRHPFSRLPPKDDPSISSLSSPDMQTDEQVHRGQRISVTRGLQSPMQIFP
eukprot:gene15145-10839_t